MVESKGRYYWEVELDKDMSGVWMIKKILCAQTFYWIKIFLPLNVILKATDLNWHLFPLTKSPLNFPKIQLLCALWFSCSVSNFKLLAMYMIVPFQYLPLILTDWKIWDRMQNRKLNENPIIGNLNENSIIGNLMKLIYQIW